MLTALVREVSPAMNRCELQYMERRPIDIAKAAAEHHAYAQFLEEMGASVITLPAQPDLPDSVFVEDPAVVVDEVAVINRTGAPSRRREAESLAEALAPFRPLRWIEEPATLEGGDVLRIGRRIYVGASERTNAAGIQQLRRAVTPFGYTVEPVEVRRCLHLKSAVTYLGGDAVLVNRRLIDTAPLEAFRMIDVAPGEPGAANTLALGGFVLVPAAYPATAAHLERQGFRVRSIDIAELMKAEAGLTCSSLIFESAIAERSRT
jgi:dimethylargininase